MKSRLFNQGMKGGHFNHGKKGNEVDVSAYIREKMGEPEEFACSKVKERKKVSETKDAGSHKERKDVQHSTKKKLDFKDVKKSFLKNTVAMLTGTVMTVSTYTGRSFAETIDDLTGLEIFGIEEKEDSSSEKKDGNDSADSGKNDSSAGADDMENPGSADAEENDDVDSTDSSDDSNDLEDNDESNDSDSSDTTDDTDSSLDSDNPDSPDSSNDADNTEHTDNNHDADSADDTDSNHDTDNPDDTDKNHDTDSTDSTDKTDKTDSSNDSDNTKDSVQNDDEQNKEEEKYYFEWSWDTDFNTATLILTDGKGNTESFLAQVTVQKTEATCTKTGEAVYTASVQAHEKTYTDQKTKSLPALGHSFGTGKRIDNGDGTETIEYTCERCKKTFKVKMKVEEE